jgi:hypothetical protein
MRLNKMNEFRKWISWFEKFKLSKYWFIQKSYFKIEIKLNLISSLEIKLNLISSFK